MESLIVTPISKASAN